MKLRADYFHPGKHHVCMFCQTPIGQLVNGKILPLGNKTHVLLSSSSGGVYVVNCCGDCAAKSDWTNQEFLGIIHDNIVEAKAFIDRLHGRTEAQIAADTALRATDHPIGEFHVIERNPSSREASIKAFDEYETRKALAHARNI